MTGHRADHQVFVSFSSHDAAKAKLICERLERDGIRCWISNRDVRPGQNYQAAIVEAIERARVMVLVFSANSNESREVPKEVSLASTFDRVVVPVRISDVRPTGALQYELATRQWVDAFEVWDEALDSLASTVGRILGPAVNVRGAPGNEAAVGALPSAMNGLVQRGGSAEAGSPTAPGAPPAISEAERDAARAALAPLVGPIADMLVRKAAARAKSVRELHDLLSRELASPDEKASFEQAVAKGPGPSGKRWR